MAKKKPTYEELLKERDAYKAEINALKRERVNRQAMNFGKSDRLFRKLHKC